MKSHLVFYAGLLYAECDSSAEFRLLRASCGSEIYNGAYLYFINKYIPGGRGWYLMDGTDVSLSNVPKELLLSVLLLT